MHRISYQILRISLGITFLWIGVLILRSPEAWGGYIQPWALKLLVLPVYDTMLIVGAVDCVLGLLFLINRFVRLAALIAAIHLLGILITSGLNDITVRDIGLLGAALALAVLPKRGPPAVTKMGL